MKKRRLKAGFEIYNANWQAKQFKERFRKVKKALEMSLGKIGRKQLLKKISLEDTILSFIVT